MTIDQVRNKLIKPINDLKVILQSVTDEISDLDGKDNPTDAQSERLDEMNEAESYLTTAIDELECI